MGKIAVVFKSKYGTTKKYAEWIAEEAGADLIENKNLKAEKLLNYDTIIYGGGLYAGGLIGFSLIKNNYDKLKGKKIIVFAVGASTKGEKAEEEVMQRNMTEEMRNSIKLFFLRGGYNYQQMKPFDKLAMYMLKKIIEKTPPEERDDDAKGILSTYGKSVNFTKRENIAPIIELLNK